MEIYVHVPYHKLDSYIDYIARDKPNIELYTSADALDRHSEDDIKRYRDLFQKAGIKIILHGPYLDMSPGGIDEKVRGITINRFISAVNMAEKFHAASIVLHAGYDKYRHEYMFERWLEQSLKTWVEVAGLAHSKGISIHLENIFDENPEVLLSLRERIGKDNVKFCFDTGHFNLFSKVALEEWIKKSAKYIAEFHIHNNYGIRDDHNSLKHGTFDFSALFNMLNREGVNAVFTIEAHTIDKILDSLDYIKGII